MMQIDMIHAKMIYGGIINWMHRYENIRVIALAGETRLRYFWLLLFPKSRKISHRIHVLALGIFPPTYG